MSTLSPPGSKVSTPMILDPFLPSTGARATSTARNWSRDPPPSPQRPGDGGLRPVGGAIRGHRSISGDKGTSLYLDALWAIQVVSSPDRFDGSVTRSDPSGGRRRHGTGRARSSHRLPAGRPAIRLERRPVGVGSGNRGRIVPLPPAGVARPDRLAPFGTVGRRRRRPAGPGPRAHRPGPTEPITSGRGFHPVERDADGRDPTGARRRRPRPDRHHPRAIGERARVARLPVEPAERLLVWCFSPGSGRGLCPFCCVASRPTSGRYSGVSSRRQTPGRRSYSRAGRSRPAR